MKPSPRWMLVVASLVAGLIAAGCGEDSESRSQSPATNDRPWLLESEFENEALYATLEQVVILYLEPQPQGVGLVENRIRYAVSETTDVRFCLPPDDPHLRHVTLVDARLGDTLLDAPRGDACTLVTIPPGTYMLSVYHDGASVPAEGAMAFIHRAAASGGGNIPAFTDRTSTGTASGPTAVQQTGAACSQPTPTSGGKNIIIQTNACPNCNLTGIDLHGLNLTGADLTAACLAGANLTGTTLREALLDSATLSPMSTQLSGTDFTYARLRCTDVSKTDLTNSVFGSLAGELFAADQSAAVIVKTDPVNGNRVEISSGTGSGTGFAQPNGVALSSAGSTAGKLFVTDPGLPAVFQVDPSNGNRTIVAGSGVGSGPVLSNPTDTAVDSTGKVLVVDSNLGVVQLDPANNWKRTLVSGAGQGAGTAFSYPAGLAIDSQGKAKCFAKQTFVADRLLGAVLRVDASGNRAVVSNDNTGVGTAFAQPIDVAIDGNGMLIVADLTLPGVFRVDPCTGNRTVVSSASVGSGEGFTNVASVAVASDGSLIVSDQVSGVIRVDATSGARTLVSGDFAQAAGIVINGSGQYLVADSQLSTVFSVSPTGGSQTVLSKHGKGEGPTFKQPSDVALRSDGMLIVTDLAFPGVFRVDPSTGNRTVVSSTSVGSGPLFSSVGGVVLSPADTIYVTDQGLGVVQVDSNTGKRTVVSGACGLQLPGGIAIDRNGKLIVADRGAAGLFSVDPAAGTCTVLSSSSRGTGPTFKQPSDVSVDSHGVLIVADLTLPGVFRVDPGTGNRTLVSSNCYSFYNVAGVVVAGNGGIFATDQVLGVFYVNPNTGSCTLISGATAGSGTVFAEPAGLAMTPTLTFDFSCRLNAAGATITPASIPVGYWRYMDLTGATINNAMAAPLSTTSDPVDLSGALLSGTMGLGGGVRLDGANLDCATPWQGMQNCSDLTDTDLHRISLKSASAVSAVMNGVNLAYANLFKANLFGAALEKSASGASANLSGVYLKNANLATAAMIGATLSNANWYSSGSVPCDGTVSPWPGKCANGSATLSDANLQGAYLAGLDLSAATVPGTIFNNAVLAGAAFNGATLGTSSSGVRTSFKGAFLEGADFTDATNSADAVFLGAYLDLEMGDTITWKLPAENLQFTGFIGSPPGGPECVSYTADSMTTAPPSAGICPDGSSGPFCTDEQWQSNVPSNASSPPAAIGALPESCTQIDYGW